MGTSETCVPWSGLLTLRQEVTLAEVENIARIERRRKWTAEEKAALLVELEAEGARCQWLPGVIGFPRACSITGARP